MILRRHSVLGDNEDWILMNDRQAKFHDGSYQIWVSLRLGLGPAWVGCGSHDDWTSMDDRLGPFCGLSRCSRPERMMTGFTTGLIISIPFVGTTVCIIILYLNSFIWLHYLFNDVTDDLYQNCLNLQCRVVTISLAYYIIHVYQIIFISSVLSLIFKIFDWHLKYLKGYI